MAQAFCNMCREKRQIWMRAKHLGLVPGVTLALCVRCKAQNREIGRAKTVARQSVRLTIVPPLEEREPRPSRWVKVEADEMMVERLMFGPDPDANGLERRTAVDLLLAKRERMSIRQIAVRTGVSMRTVERRRKLHNSSLAVEDSIHDAPHWRVALAGVGAASGAGRDPRR